MLEFSIFCVNHLLFFSDHNSPLVQRAHSSVNFSTNLKYCSSERGNNGLCFFYESKKSLTFSWYISILGQCQKWHLSLSLFSSARPLSLSFCEPSYSSFVLLNHSLGCPVWTFLHCVLVVRAASSFVRFVIVTVVQFCFSDV